MAELDWKIDLPAGWTCLIELQMGADGHFSGSADLQFEGKKRCALFVAAQPNEAAALERIAFRSRYFIDEWMARPHSGETEFAEPI